MRDGEGHGQNNVGLSVSGAYCHNDVTRGRPTAIASDNVFVIIIRGSGSNEYFWDEVEWGKDVLSLNIIAIPLLSYNAAPRSQYCCCIPVPC